MSELTDYLDFELTLAASPAGPTLYPAPAAFVQAPPLPPPPDTTLLRANEAAKIVKVSAQTVYRWMQTGALKSFRIGRVTRVRRCDLDQFILNNLTQ